MQTSHNPFKQAFESKGLFPEVTKKLEEDERRIQLEKEEEFRKKREEARLQSIKDRENRELYSIFKNHITDLKYIKDEEGRTIINEKGRNKLFHIICSYIPFPSIEKLWNFKGKQKNCCFCKRGVIPFAELIEKGADLLLENIRIDLKTLDGQTTEVEIKKEKEHLFKETFGDRKMGYTSSKTDTVMCSLCFEQFMNWISNSCLEEDSMVLSAIKKMRSQHGKGI